MSRGRKRLIRGSEVARMSLEEFDQYFDEKGRPRPGIVYRPTTVSDDELAESQAYHEKLRAALLAHGDTYRVALIDDALAEIAELRRQRIRPVRQLHRLRDDEP